MLMSGHLLTESPSATVGLRWFRWFWMTSSLVFSTWVSAYIAASEWSAGSMVASLTCGFVALGAGHLLVGLLRLGWASFVQSSALRADHNGLKHCLLPVVPWPAIRGIDVRKYIPMASVHGGGYRFALVIACDRQFLLTWYQRWVWDLLNWVGPRYDLNQSLLEFKLEFLPVEPSDLLTKLTALAQSYEAPLVKTWVHGHSIDVALQREQSFEALKARDMEMQSVLRTLNLAAHEEALSAKEIPKH